MVNEFISKFLWSVGASEMGSPDTVAQGFPCGGGGTCWTSQAVHLRVELFTQRKGVFVYFVQRW